MAERYGPASGDQLAEAWLDLALAHAQLVQWDEAAVVAGEAEAELRSAMGETYWMVEFLRQFEQRMLARAEGGEPLPLTVKPLRDLGFREQWLDVNSAVPEDMAAWLEINQSSFD